MIAMVRRAGGDTGEIRLPEMSEIVSHWALPAMSAALAEDEEERKAFALLKSVQDLKRRHEQKRTSV